MSVDSGPCIIRSLPLPLRAPARRESIRERIDNFAQGLEGLLHAPDPVPLQLVVQNRKRWTKNRVLGVGLNGASREQRVQAIQWLEEGWAASCSLSFREAAWDKAEIRFTVGRGGNFSFLGTDCVQGLPSGQPSGNIQDWVKGIWLHEVGHAIDCAHNMQAPNNPLHPDWAYLVPWARRTQGWSEQQLRAQYELQSATEVQYSQVWDPASILQYWQEPEWNLERVRIPQPEDLSDEDRAFVGRADVYDTAEAPPVEPPKPKPQPDEPPPKRDPGVVRLSWGVAETIPYRRGAVSRAQLPELPEASAVTIRIQERAAGSPLLDVVPEGGDPMSIPATAGATRNVVRFPFRVAGAGRYEVQVRFSGGAAPQSFTILAERK